MLRIGGVVLLPSWDKVILATIVPAISCAHGICSYGPALQIMESKLGKENLISRSLTVLDNPPGDGRTRYPIEMRAGIYQHLLGTIRRLQPELTCALCMGCAPGPRSRPGREHRPL